MLRIAELIEANADELAALESLDNGKAIVEARFDIAGAAEVFRYYAGWPTKLHGDTNPTEARFVSYTVREPVGVCAQIVPWNFPLLMASWKLGPALACGNTIVLKPAEQTPLTTLRFAQLLAETAIPDGVVNIVTGDGATGAYLARHPGVDKVAFTGSTEVGRSVMAGAAETIKRVSLELGGKNANIVFADADLERAVTGALEGAFENAGQACTAGSRLLVERSIHDGFVEALVERAKELVVGPGLDESTHIGALVSAEQRDRVEGYVAIGADEGAELVLRGDRPDGAGYFVPPTIFTNATPTMRISREEIFGPVLGVTPFDSEADAVAIANGTEYGLAAGIWTGDIKRGHRVARALHAGTVWINAYGSVRPTVPFGGVKQSGYGRELGLHSLDLYSELKSVFVDVS
jgi:acyl-CoA reductase-like NAD-dependent aldehyde dehydrogenase